jgi:plasmid stabilization system protein ParE
LGKAYLAAVETAIQKLAAHPLHYRKLGRSVRRCLVHRFPYGIIFLVEKDFIFIAAVMHLKREPNYWQDRLKK